VHTSTTDRLGMLVLKMNHIGKYQGLNGNTRVYTATV